MRALLIVTTVFASAAVFGCGGASGASTPTTTATTSGIARATDIDRIRRLEAFQTRNPDWSVRLDDAGRLVVTTRWASLRREDIRPEVEPFLAVNAADLGLAPDMARVVNEPEHVRYEGRDGRSRAVDARLDGGAIVVTAE